MPTIYTIIDEDGDERQVSYCYLCDAPTPAGCQVCDKCEDGQRGQYARDLREAAWIGVAR